MPRNPTHRVFLPNPIHLVLISPYHHSAQHASHTHPRTTSRTGTSHTLGRHSTMLRMTWFTIPRRALRFLHHNLFAPRFSRMLLPLLLSSIKSFCISARTPVIFLMSQFILLHGALILLRHGLFVQPVSYVLRAPIPPSAGSSKVLSRESVMLPTSCLFKFSKRRIVGISSLCQQTRPTYRRPSSSLDPPRPQRSTNG